MVSHQTIARRRVLHVAPRQHDPARQIETALRAAGCEVVSVPDVYRALARIGRLGAEAFSAVVVCVDRLQAEELEFFQLVARHHREIPAHAYGQSHAAARLETAVDLGARRLADPDAVAREFAARNAPAPVPVVAEPPPRARPDSAGEETAGPSAAAPPSEQPSTPPEPLESTAPEPPAQTAEQVKPKKEPAAGAARVPWLRYEGGPKRTPPQRSRGKVADQEPPQPETEPEPEPAPQAAEDAEGDPPLLSPEELRALIGGQEEEEGGTRNNTVNRGRKP